MGQFICVNPFSEAEHLCGAQFEREKMSREVLYGHLLSVMNP